MNVRNEDGEIRVSVKWIAAIGTFLIAFVGGVITMDSRYAHADDVEKQISTISNQTRYAADLLRKQMLEDKIFELALARSPTDVQRALLDRYRTQSQEIDRRWTRPMPTTLANPQ